MDACGEGGERRVRVRRRRHGHLRPCDAMRGERRRRKLDGGATSVSAADALAVLDRCDGVPVARVGRERHAQRRQARELLRVPRVRVAVEEAARSVREVSTRGERRRLVWPLTCGGVDPAPRAGAPRGGVRRRAFGCLGRVVRAAAPCAVRCWDAGAVSACQRARTVRPPGGHLLVARAVRVARRVCCNIDDVEMHCVRCDVVVQRVSQRKLCESV